jgi:RNA polymerase sigma-70 factor (ECF subfamily)
VLAYLRGQGAEDPEASLGDVFLQVARNISTFDGDEAGFRSWVFIVAHHRVLDDRRRRRRRPSIAVAEVPDAVGGSTEDEALAGMLDVDVLQALGFLTPEQRDVVLLRVFSDLSLDDVSRVLNRPVSAVKALQRRAYARLREKLQSEPYPSEHDRR